MKKIKYEKRGVNSVRIFLMICILGCLSLSAQGQDDNFKSSKFKKLFIKEWKVKEAFLNGQKLPEGFMDNYWMDIKKSGTYKYIQPTDPSTIKEGTWRYVEKSRLVVVENDVEIEQWKIKSISKDEMTLEVDHPQGKLKIICKENE